MSSATRLACRESTGEPIRSESEAGGGTRAGEAGGYTCRGSGRWGSNMRRVDIGFLYEQQGDDAQAAMYYRWVCGGGSERRYSTLHIPCPPVLYAYVLLSPSIRDPRRLIRDTRRSIRDIQPVNSGHSAVEYRELTGEYRELTGEYRELTGEYLELMDRSNMRSSLSVISMYFDL